MVAGDATDHLDEVAEQIVTQAPVVAGAVGESLVLQIHRKVDHLDGREQGGKLPLLRVEDGGAGDGQGGQKLIAAVVDDEIGDRCGIVQGFLLEKSVNGVVSAEKIPGKAVVRLTELLDPDGDLLAVFNLRHGLCHPFSRCGYSWSQKSGRIR